MEGRANCATVSSTGPRTAQRCTVLSLCDRRKEKSFSVLVTKLEQMRTTLW